MRVKILPKGDKGQLISKCLFGSIFKRTKKFDFTTKVPQVELFFSFVFWENWRHQKDISKLTDLYLQINFETFPPVFRKILKTTLEASFKVKSNNVYL